LRATASARIGAVISAILATPMHLSGALPDWLEVVAGAASLLLETGRVG
jgi:hypothetical protein